jgi:HTH-type transcriptional regulator/antitoxin HigA
MFDTNKYLELLKQYPPRPIYDKEELENTERVISSFLDKIISDKIQLTIEEREYLNVLGALIYEYEENYEHEENQEPIPDIYGLELLKFILEERNLQKQDLLSIFESKSTLDDIFDGLQELTPIYIQKLADFFNISPALFSPKQIKG